MAVGPPYAGVDLTESVQLGFGPFPSPSSPVENLVGRGKRLGLLHLETLTVSGEHSVTGFGDENFESAVGVGVALAQQRSIRHCRRKDGALGRIGTFRNHEVATALQLEPTVGRSPYYDHLGITDSASPA